MRLSKAIVVAMSASALLACSRFPAPKGPVPPHLDEDQYAVLEFFGARNLNCPQDQLTYEAFAGTARHLFKGCGTEMEMLLLEGTDAEAMGYDQGFVLPSPSNGYSKERTCDVRTTSVERVDHRTRIVDGCGHRVTYLMACGAGGCTWIANTELTRTGPTP